MPYFRVVSNPYLIGSETSAYGSPGYSGAVEYEIQAEAVEKVPECKCSLTTSCPAGPPGPKGSPGAHGSDGEDGSAGIDGKEPAVYEELLASLAFQAEMEIQGHPVGQTSGTMGAEGPPGVDGELGPVGAPGMDGIKGQGKTGAKVKAHLPTM
ncbi:hypothetical protein ANCDUO_08690 [Ancylostoma duodenale]|uniref:Collagen triple helix repeat protein n=1 Tax=Ancylostoma duodenale TaxID=51022 RepID=A0A0C2DF34_9BILA|nr:hypothetical protein ANCDUO_08690 [Ancylostoma duodenale]